MKTHNFQKPLLVIVTASLLSFPAGNAVAQDSSASTTTPLATTQTVPQLSYGVPQIVQLSQAKVSDSTILAYIQNSGNSYGLDANQIIYLRQQGVSDAVVNAMLNQHNNVVAAAAQTTAQATTSPPQQSYSDTSARTSVAVAQPTAPPYVSSSTVYIIPDTQTYQYNAYYYQPYYYPYYAWPYPVVSYSFGFGGRWGGGYYHGGGWHGGGRVYHR